MAWTSRLPVHVGSLNRLAIESRVSECFALPPLPLRERSTREARRVRGSLPAPNAWSEPSPQPSPDPKSGIPDFGICDGRSRKHPTSAFVMAEVGSIRLRLGEGADNLYFPERRLGCL